MQISTILDHIDSGHMALPEFQRGYVWNRDQVKGFFDSLYRRHPVGGLLVWVTESKTAAHRGNGELAPGVVKLLLDGQQRITSLYGVIRGKPPKFFDGNPQNFSSLYFHLESETFSFYQPVKMQGDPLWIDVTDVMKKGTDGVGKFASILSANPEYAAKLGDYLGRLAKLLGIKEISLHEDEVTGQDKTLDVVVDIFNRVNSGGTKLSKGDLALAKICADWPEARQKMKAFLKEWSDAGYYFNLDWMLRAQNTVLTGEAKFSFLHNKTSVEVQNGLNRTVTHINTCLNHIGGRLGLDHDEVLLGRYAIPVMVRVLDQHPGPLPPATWDKLLFWFVQAGMWGRFSGSTESVIDQDLAAIADNNGLDKLLEQLRLWHGGLKVEAGHFVGWSLGARFYPVLYMLTRAGEAKDWGTGLPLKANLLGRMNRLEVHHIFPKAQLYKHGYRRDEVNALANYCFLTKDSNLRISDRRPEEYFPEIEAKNPGALKSQWIPSDPELWKISNFRDFLRERRELLATQTNSLLADLLHGDMQWLDGPSQAVVAAAPPIVPVALPAISLSDTESESDTVSESEENVLYSLNDWVVEKGLPRGQVSYTCPDTDSTLPGAVFDLAWPNGIQEGLSQPVAVLLNEEPGTLQFANTAGYRYFTDIETFKAYILKEVLGEVAA